MVADIETKKCSMCKQDKCLSSYRNRGGSQKHLLKSRCNTCLYKQHKNWIENNPEKVREYREKDSWTLLKRCSRRGITPKELIEKYEKQNQCCPICNKEISLTDSAIDHTHLTEKFRGVLCKKCNRGLGLFEDSPNILENALNYLKTEGYYGTS
jgi:hypothetical protein